MRTKFTCCYRCEKREVGCHSTCEDYLKLKEEADTAREQRIKDVNLHGIIQYGGKRHEKRGQR